MKRLLFVACLLLLAAPVGAQVSVPNTFTAGQTISASKMNANFAKLDDALDRTGGTMTGTLTSQQITPATTATYDLGTTAAKFRAVYLSGDAHVGGQLIIGSTPVTLTNAAGKIPAISTTYFASVDGSALTNLTAANITAAGTLPALNGAALTNLDATNISSGYLGNAYGGVPTGMIAFFATTSCPTGWTAYAAAEGRYIVGVPLAGTVEGTKGTALTDLLARTHTHSVPGLSVPGLSVPGLSIPSLTVPGLAITTTLHQVASGTGQGVIDSVTSPTASGSTGTGTTGIGTTGTGTTGTGTSGTASDADIAPYIQLLACQKDS